MVKNSLSQCFAQSYAEARQKFLTSCANRADWLKSWQHPLRGIQGEKLYLDLAWLGKPDAPKVLVLISGTHGIEGFAGSGIQVYSLATDWYKPRADIALVMIHGLNSWGMSHFRRVNEEGVDLNRNFVNFQQPLPSNSLYDALAEIIVPSEWTVASQNSTFAQLFDYLSQSEENIAALAQGQYDYWYAPFYGGVVPSWSNRIFDHIIQEYLSNKQAVGLIDYHTGLGAYATGQLISLPPKTPVEQSILSSIGQGKIAIAGSINSVAPYHPYGTLIARVRERLDSTICIPGVHEFGTIAETEVFHALRADHWLYTHGELNSSQAKTIKQQMLAAFYCDRPDWQESICHQALTVQKALFAALESI